MVKMEEKNMPRKGENIYKRKDGRWEARYIYAFKEDGSPRYRSIYAADYLTVKKKQNDAKRKMDPRLFQSVRMKKNISFYGLLWLERLKRCLQYTDRMIRNMSEWEEKVEKIKGGDSKK